MISNSSANGIAFVKFGTSTEVASTVNGVPVLPGHQRMIGVLPAATQLRSR